MHAHVIYYTFFACLFLFCSRWFIFSCVRAHPLISLSRPFIPIGGGGGNVISTIFKWDIYWLFTPLSYTLIIILISYHKFPHNACSCDPLHLLRSLFSLIPEVVYLLVCPSSPFQLPKIAKLGLLSDLHAF